MNELGSNSRPLRVAIVGSGPSGFYAAAALFKSELTVEVDMFDRLPTPFGLVRGGVAPDHEKIKNVTKVYERIAAHDGFYFWGDVNVGRDISVDELTTHFDAVIFACGAQTDRRLDIPGIDLPGSYTATEFVGWYNGHPDYRDQTFDLSHETAVIVGVGNVAMDVTRILSKTVDELRETDIADYALDVLAESKIKHIHLIGRRGPVQAKFTPPEIKEIGELMDCEPVFDHLSDLELDPISRQELADADGQIHRNLDILVGFVRRQASHLGEAEPVHKRKRFHIHFYESPKELKGTDRVERIVLERNRLVGEPFHSRSEGTGELEEIECGVFFRSVGYRGVEIPGVPFDERKGIFPNKDGRIIDGDKSVPRLYAAGWIKRGPSGVIGTNKPDSYETVQALLEDVPTLEPCAQPDSDRVRDLLNSRNIRIVTFDDWHQIDAAEIERGKSKGKPREKFTTIEDMLTLLDD